MMESSNLLSQSATSVFTLLAISLSLFFLFVPSLIRFSKRVVNHDKRMAVPEASGSWPLLGHLHLLGGPEPPHLVLAKLANHCGPIFTVRLGVHRAIVVSTWEIAKECLTTHDRTFATRSKSVSSDVMTYNYAMLGLSPYGPYWRHIRKISTLELLSSHRIKILEHVRDSEVRRSVKDAYRNKVVADPSTTSLMLVDMKRWFEETTHNIIFRMIIGKRFSDEEVDEKAKQAMREWFELSGRFVVSDGLPFLRWLDIGGHEKAMKRTSEELNRVMQRWLDEHKAKRNLCGDSIEEEKIDQDFMDVLLSTLDQDKKKVHTYDVDTVNKATCLAMVLAGSDTSAVTMTWALSLLLNHKECLNKVQQELDSNIGRDKAVKESDLINLPYLQAVIKETMRLYPAAPLAIPHEATQDCTVQGFFVPKGTRLLVNIYKIQRDSRVWSDPNEFKPERFLTTHKELDVRGQNFEFIPFGSGRRICPGISLALPLLGLTLASFLQAFDVRVPGDESVDMTEAIGMTNLKATPLEVLITPRLLEFVY